MSLGRGGGDERWAGALGEGALSSSWAASAASRLDLGGDGSSDDEADAAQVPKLDPQPEPERSPGAAAAFFKARIRSPEAAAGLRLSGGEGSDGGSDDGDDADFMTPPPR